MTCSGKTAKPRGSLFLIIAFLSDDLAQGPPERRSQTEGPPTPRFQVTLNSERRSGSSPKGSLRGA